MLYDEIARLNGQQWVKGLDMFQVPAKVTMHIVDCVYALRHTMHHHGELCALAVYHSNEGGIWE